MPSQEPPRSYAGGAAQLARSIRAVETRLLAQPHDRELTPEDIEELARLFNLLGGELHLWHGRADLERLELAEMVAAEVSRRMRWVWVAVAFVGLVAATGWLR